ncbi:MAG: hypothetical protein FWD48_00935, partial [Oscillospiraceae bacterium]|nr:hypothetical protein [Oscillospiraceae bacterium]
MNSKNIMKNITTLFLVLAMLVSMIADMPMLPILPPALMASANVVPDLGNLVGVIHTANPNNLPGRADTMRTGNATLTPVMSGSNQVLVGGKLLWQLLIPYDMGFGMSTNVSGTLRFVFRFAIEGVTILPSPPIVQNQNPIVAYGSYIRTRSNSGGPRGSLENRAITISSPTADGVVDFTANLSQNNTSVDAYEKFLRIHFTWGEPSSDGTPPELPTFICRSCEWNESVLDIKPTCTLPGEHTTTRTCKSRVCDATEIDRVFFAPLGHDIDGDVKLPTCTDDGSVAGGFCIRDGCNATFGVETIDALGHFMSNWEDTWREWNSGIGYAQNQHPCLRTGERVQRCLNSGCDEQQAYNLPAKGHIFIGNPTINSPANCNSQGSATGICWYCGGANAVTVTLPALGPLLDDNDWEIIEPANCLKPATLGRSCKRPGCNCEVKTQKEYIGYIRSHVLDDWKVITPATCAETGLERSDCTYSDCNYYRTNIIPSGTHDICNDGCGECVVCSKCLCPDCSHCDDSGDCCEYCNSCDDSCPCKLCDHNLPAEWSVKTAPTCVVAGEESKKCSRCDYEITQPIDTISHAYGGYDQTQAP